MKERNNGPIQIGDNIKKVRLLRGIKREEMADALFICTKQYANIENNKSKLDVERLIQIAQILNVNTNTLLKLNYEEFLTGETD